MAYQTVESGVLIQFGNYSSTFTLTDDQDVMPQVVLIKNFTMCDNIAQIVENQKSIDQLTWANIYLAAQNG